jgi:Ca2+-binding RTX toxin-like protein
VEVLWNGQVVATVQPIASGTHGIWITPTVTVTGTGNLDRLTLREVGNQGSDGLGALIDNTTLVVAGEDQLQGGAGDDVFQLNSGSEGGDLIWDFGSLPGNNDVFHVSAAEFGAGLVAGASLAQSQLQIRTDNLAQDSDDRFVFRTTDTTLWFDQDGDGSAAAVLVADLQAGATLTSADLLLV